MFQVNYSILFYIFRLVDCFLVDSPVTSLSISPTSDFLVTSHLDDVGVYLWSNMTLFSHVSLTALSSDYEPKLVDMPSSGKQALRRFFNLMCR